MARLSTTTTIIIILSLALLLSLSYSSHQQEDTINNGFVRTMDRKKLNKQGFKNEKLSHFRFYWHDTYTGKSPSAVAIVQPSNRTKTATMFGSVSMIDDPLTDRPDPGSRLLGRAQGFYGSASKSEVALIMAMNFHFVQGKYNGSTITILGRNPVFEKAREMPVIGGSGLFRFARGFARASTHTVDLATGDAVVEYNVYVLHYG